MDLWTYIAGGIFAFIILVLVVLKSKIKKPSFDAEDFAYDDSDLRADVEYVWEAPALPAWVPVMVLIGAGVFLFVAQLIDLPYLTMKNLFRYGLAFLGIFFSLVTRAFKKYRYQMTHGGIYRKDLSDQKKKEKLLFSWDQLLWFKPGTHGFRYYLKQSSGALEQAEGKAAGRLIGHIPTGEHATVINAIIMGRSVPMSPPQKMLSIDEFPLE